MSEIQANPTSTTSTPPTTATSASSAPKPLQESTFPFDSMSSVINSAPVTRETTTEQVDEAPKASMKKKKQPTEKATLTPGKPPKVTKKQEQEMREEFASRVISGASIGKNPAEHHRIVILRKKLRNYFRFFPHKLRPAGYEYQPPFHQMTLPQLELLESDVHSAIYDCFEGEYIESALIAATSFIEHNGVSMANRLRWLPGADTLRFQNGLCARTKELLSIPGDLQDAKNYLGIQLTGYAPANPYVSFGMQFIRLLSTNADFNRQASVVAAQSDGL